MSTVEAFDDFGIRPGPGLATSDVRQVAALWQSVHAAVIQTNPLLGLFPEDLGLPPEPIGRREDLFARTDLADARGARGYRLHLMLSHTSSRAGNLKGLDLMEMHLVTMWAAVKLLKAFEKIGLTYSLEWDVERQKQKATVERVGGDMRKTTLHTDFTTGVIWCLQCMTRKALNKQEKEN